MSSAAKERVETLISDIEDAVDIPDSWEIGIAQSTGGYSAELRKGDLGAEEATIEFVSDDAASTLYVHHVDVPTFGAAQAKEHGEEVDLPIPGPVGDVDFNSFDDAAAVVNELLQPGAFEDLLAWMNAEENPWELETAIVEHLDADPTLLHS